MMEYNDDNESHGPLRVITNSPSMAEEGAMAGMPESPSSADAEDEWKPNRDYVPRALLCLPIDNPFRKFMIQTIEHRFFEPVILTLITVNCIILGLYNPLQDIDQGRNVIISGSESFFVAAFALEMVIKIIACGFIHDGRDSEEVRYQEDKVRVPAYIRDGWNILDFVVVVVGILSLFPGVKGNFSALRTVRVLRPIRAISILKGMRVLVGTMIKSIPMIGNVMLMCVFLFIVFGILGINVFQGRLRYRCFEGGPGSENITLVDPDNSTAVDYGNFTVVDDEQVCATDIFPWKGWICPGTEECLNYGENPHYGVTSFDNFGWACLTIFQVITLEGWTTVMYMCMDSTTGWSFLYFIAIVFLGSFFVLQLALGVITDVYEAEEAEMKQLAELEKAEDERLKREELAKIGKTLEEYHEEQQEEEDAAEAREVDGYRDFLHIRRICKAITNTGIFKTGILIMILVNTVVLAMEYYGMSATYEYVVIMLNLVLTCIFTAEMILKMIALGFHGYVKDRFNIFDAVVVVFSLMEIVLGAFMGGQGGAALSGFRAFRILRVLKLVNSWGSLKSFITVMFKTIKELGNFCLIVLLVVFIFSLLGMMMFGGKMEVNGEVPRTNYDNLVWSAVTVFQVLTGEDWNWIMYDSINATDASAALFYIALIVIGDFMILNLFVAILLSNFGNPGDEDEEDEPKPRGRDDLRAAAKGRISGYTDMCWRSPSAVDLDDPAEGDAGASVRGEASVDAEGVDVKQEDQDDGEKYTDETYEREVDDPNKGSQPYPLEAYTKNALLVFSPTNTIRRVCYSIADDKRFDWLMMSLIFISSACIAIETPWMSQKLIDILFIVDLVFTTCFTIEMLIKVVALGFIRDHYSYLRNGWNILDFIVVVLSIFSLSFTGMDLSVVKTFRGLRMLRPLRVINRVPELKMVVNAMFASLPGMGNVLIVSLLFWLIFGILGMQLFLGTFFSCDSNRCCAPLEDAIMDPAVTYQNCSATFWDDAVAFDTIPLPSNATVCCIDSDSLCCEVKHVDQCIGGCQWKNAPSTFDNILVSMLTLFEMCTTEGWAGIMYQGVDSVGIGYQPQRDNRVVMVLYFVFFMIIGFFFIINLFVGIILDKFSEEHKKGNNPLLTDEQAKWVATQCRVMGMPLKKSVPLPENEVRKSIYTLVESNTFDYFIMICIGLNTAFLAMEHYNQNEAWTDVQYYSNVLFTFIFAIEALLKIIGLGIKGYFTRKGNCFDFFLVLISIVGMFVNSGVGTNFLRIFRVARVFRLIKALKGLRILFTALVVSIPTMINVAGLAFLLLFMYSVIGVNFFGRVQFGEELTRHANFRNFGTALLTLLRIITGEAWNSIMHDCMVQPPDCDPSQQPYCALLGTDGGIMWNTTDGNLSPIAAPGVATQEDCTCESCSWRELYDIDNCGANWAPIYFVSFFMLGAFIMLNLIIAVILENFSSSKSSSDEDISENDFSMLRKKWAMFDPYANGYIAMADLPRLVAAVKPPLGLEGEKITRLRMIQFQRELDVTPVDGNVYWHDVLQALFRRVSQIMNIDYDLLPQNVQNQLSRSKERMERKHTGNLKKQHLDPEVQKAMQGMDASDIYRISIVQAAYRGSKSRREVVEMIEESQRKEKALVEKGISEHITSLLEAAKYAYDNNVTLDEANQNRPESPLVTAEAIRPAQSFLFMDYSTPPQDDSPSPAERPGSFSGAHGSPPMIQMSQRRIPKTPLGAPLLPPPS